MNFEEEDARCANLRKLEDDELELQETVNQQLKSLAKKMSMVEERRVAAAVEDDNRRALQDEAIRTAAREAAHLKQAQQLREYLCGVTPDVDIPTSNSDAPPYYAAYFPDGTLVPDGPVPYWDARTLIFPDSSDDEK
eukprot:TRINITY_DN19640_c0_g1_i1.p1 TRINITY_DN19640_c0_g1~~TRINITY_DN19640_c0_g1_i1.p1  ORF type:complete len:137 (+),score=44.57 TRINITY_DN19640_c0_g1_i1:93-503(+)